MTTVPQYLSKSNYLHLKFLFTELHDLGWYALGKSKLSTQKWGWSENKYAIQMYYTSFIDRHSSMLNLTTRLAVNIRYLPDWEVDWSDTCPQRSRESLTHHK